MVVWCCAKKGVCGYEALLCATTLTTDKGKGSFMAFPICQSTLSTYVTHILKKNSGNCKHCICLIFAFYNFFKIRRGFLWGTGGGGAGKIGFFVIVWEMYNQ